MKDEIFDIIVPGRCSESAASSQQDNDRPPRGVVVARVQPLAEAVRVKWLAVTDSHCTGCTEVPFALCCGGWWWLDREKGTQEVPVTY